MCSVLLLILCHTDHQMLFDAHGSHVASNNNSTAGVWSLLQDSLSLLCVLWLLGVRLFSCALINSHRNWTQGRRIPKAFVPGWNPNPVDPIPWRNFKEENFRRIHCLFRKAATLQGFQPSSFPASLRFFYCRIQSMHSATAPSPIPEGDYSEYTKLLYTESDH